MGFSLAETLIGVFGKTLDKFVVDKDKKEEFISELRNVILQNEKEIIQAASDNVKAEIQGESWLQKNWRPVFMMVGVFIIFNNFVLAPYVKAFTGFDLMLKPDFDTIPIELWNLLEIGMGGYIIGRSGEKIVQHLSQNKSKKD